MFFSKSKESEKVDGLIRTTLLELALNYELMANLAMGLRRSKEKLNLCVQTSYRLFQIYRPD